MTRKNSKTAQKPPKSMPIVAEKTVDVVQVEQKIVTKAPIVNKVIDAAVVDQVIDKKHIEVHKQDVITEIHEQPIIEIHEKPVTQFVKEDTVFSKLTKDTVMEEIQAAPMSEEELLLNTAALATQVETLRIEENTINQIEEKELIKRIEIQPVVELHEQPHITEIHEQKIVEVIETPVVRIIHEQPIIKRFVDAPLEPTTIKTVLKAEKTEEFKMEQKEFAGLSFAERLEKEQKITFLDKSNV